MITIEIQMLGQEKIIESMATLVAQTADLSAVFKLIEKWWFGWQKQVFDSQGSALNNKEWADLTERYKVRKKKKYGFVYPILQASRDMYRQVTGGTGAYKRIEKQEMALGVTGKVGDYWRVHNFGHHYRHNNATMPKRHFDNVNDKAIKELRMVIRMYLIGLARKMAAEFREETMSEKIVR